MFNLQLSPVCLIFLAITAIVVTGLPTERLQISGTRTAMMYLSRFGYMNNTITNRAVLPEETVREAVMKFQAFAGISQTGIIDEKTKEIMDMKRCGNKDIIGDGEESRRTKRYALQGSRWSVRDLTYRISKYPSRLSRSEVDFHIARAFQVWEDVSSLTFRAASSGKIHIDIRFENGEHGDGDPFDGPGGTLAHAYFPIYGGDAHFDDTETWTIDSYRGTNLFQVAAHEFGHSLGLLHSDVRSSLMAPFYTGYQPSFKLDIDDIKAIQSLYGKKESSSTTQRPPNQPTSTTRRPIVDDSSALCQDSKFDAIVTMVDKKTYVFKGSKYWLLNEDSIAPGYPRDISSDWDGLPGNLDAAFTWTNGKTYFFKGSMYWRFTDLTMDNDYPRLISKEFVGIPNNVDAAFVWSGNDQIYFTKGSKFWRFDSNNLKASRPYDLSSWRGVPNNLEDALQFSNGYTYFFKDGQYYRFNDRSFSVDTANPRYPRPTGHWWFGCRSASQRVPSSAPAI